MEILNDHEIRERLRDIDDGPIEVTDWEAGFFDSLFTKYTDSLTDKQKDCALKIIAKYRDR